MPADYHNFTKTFADIVHLFIQAAYNSKRILREGPSQGIAQVTRTIWRQYIPDAGAPSSDRHEPLGIPCSR